MLGTLPYLALKTAWLTGSTAGVADPALFRDGSVFVLNAVTAGMDLVAIVVALAFTYSWGHRVPGLFILVPVWVGTALLDVAGGALIGLTSLALLSASGARRPCTAASAHRPRTRGGR